MNSKVSELLKVNDKFLKEHIDNMKNKKTSNKDIFFGVNVDDVAVGESKKYIIRMLPNDPFGNPQLMPIRTHFGIPTTQTKEDGNPIKKSFVCPKTFDAKAFCPICALAYKAKEEGDDEIYKKYRSGTYRWTLIVDKTDPSNYKLRIFKVPYGAYKRILELFDEESAEGMSPLDPFEGCDIIYKATRTGAKDYPYKTEVHKLKRAPIIPEYSDEQLVKFIEDNKINMMDYIQKIDGEEISKEIGVGEELKDIDATDTNTDVDDDAPVIEEVKTEEVKESEIVIDEDVKKKKDEILQKILKKKEVK